MPLSSPADVGCEDETHVREAERMKRGLLANKLIEKGLRTTCKPLANNLQRGFFTCNPLAKGFWPLANYFALLANNLQRFVTETC